MDNNSIYPNNTPQQPQQQVYQQPVYQQPVYQQPVYQQPQYTPVVAASTADAGSAFTFGLLSLIFCGTGILGLIFAIVSKNKLKAYLAEGGVLAGKAKAAKILSTLGLIFSIFMMVYIVIAIIVAIIGGLSGYSYYSSYNW